MTYTVSSGTLNSSIPYHTICFVYVTYTSFGASLKSEMSVNICGW